MILVLWKMSSNKTECPRERNKFSRHYEINSSLLWYRHEQLLGLDGLYAEMWNEQLTKKEDLANGVNINADIKEEDEEGNS